MQPLSVRGVNSRKKQYQLQRLLSDKRLDFLAVQENKMAEDNIMASALRPFLVQCEVFVSHAVGMWAGCFLVLEEKRTLFKCSRRNR